MTKIHDDPIIRAAAPFVAGLLMAALVAFAPQVLNDGDTYWHLATGQWILDHRAVPHADVFSFSRPGVPWVAHEWLSDALMALAYRAGGWSGLVAVFAAATGLAAWLLVRRVSFSIGGLTLFTVSLLAFACMSVSLLARPQLFMLPVMLLWLGELIAAREQDRAPRLPFVLLMTLWANLHGSYVLGFVLAGAFGLEALIEQKDSRLKVIRDWGLFAAASLVAILITPHGVAGITYPFQIMGMTILPYITEWRAADFSKLSAFEMALLATIFVCLLRGVRVPQVRLLLLLLLLHMALQHTRHQLVLAMVAPLLLAGPLGQALEHAPARPAIKRGLLLVAGLVAAVLIAARLIIPIERTDGLNSPVSALAHVPADLVRQPVLNGYGFGGYLIFKGVKPFIDGRSDMYGDAFSAAYFRATRPDKVALDKLLADYRIAWTILEPGDPVVAVLDADPRWRRIHADDQAVVHRSAEPAIRRD